MSLGKYALVRFVSAFTCCDGGLPEGSDVHEAAGYILELHQPNVSTSWQAAQLSVLDVRWTGPTLLQLKQGNSGGMNSPDWAQVKIQYGYCYRSFARGYETCSVWKQVSSVMKTKVRCKE